MPDIEIIFSVQESPEGGYEARALGYSIFTQAETMDELKQNVREAVHCECGAPLFWSARFCAQCGRAVDAS